MVTCPFPRISKTKLRQHCAICDAIPHSRRNTMHKSGERPAPSRHSRWKPFFQRHVNAPCGRLHRSSGTCHRNFRGNPRRPRTNGGCCGYQFFKLYTLNGRVLYQSNNKNRPLTGRYTLGDHAISPTKNRCALLNAQGDLTFYRILNTEQKIFPRKGLTPVINLQVPQITEPCIPHP